MRRSIQGDPGHRLQGGRGHEGGHRTHGRRWRAGRRRHIGVLALREGRLQVVVPAVRVPHRLAGGGARTRSQLRRGRLGCKIFQLIGLPSDCQ